MSAAGERELLKKKLRGELIPSFEARVAWYHRMQETEPLRYRPEDTLWEVFLYRDVQRVLVDPATFSVDASLLEGFPGVLVKCDPPEHRQVRGLVSKAFTPGRLEALTPRLIEITEELLGPAIARGKMDVVAELASPLPVRVIAEMLGLPPGDQERFRQWSHQLFGQMVGLWHAENTELVQYFSDLLDERKSNPRDDLMSALLRAQDEGERLTREEIVSLCLELMMAGNVTITMLLSRGLSFVCQHPEIYRALRDDPSLIAPAIEELLRYTFHTTSQWRTALRDTVINGREIKAGQHVVLWTEAANFDETVFPHS